MRGGLNQLRTSSFKGPIREVGGPSLGVSCTRPHQLGGCAAVYGGLLSPVTQDEAMLGRQFIGGAGIDEVTGEDLEDDLHLNV